MEMLASPLDTALLSTILIIILYSRVGIISFQQMVPPCNLSFVGVHANWEQLQYCNVVCIRTKYCIIPRNNIRTVNYDR